METAEVKKIIEALLFVADQPVSTAVMKSVLGEVGQGCDVEALIKEIGEEYSARGSAAELRFIAGGWQLATRREFSSWIRKLFKEKTTLKLSNSALETLSVIAYKQPITRSEIEEIRGVETSGVLETILERKLVKIVGRKETIGRPLLYGTTQEFLKHFGLSHLSELPSLEELTPPDEEGSETEDTSPELPLEEVSGSSSAEEGNTPEEGTAGTDDTPAAENLPGEENLPNGEAGAGESGEPAGDETEPGTNA